MTFFFLSLHFELFLFSEHVFIDSTLKETKHFPIYVPTIKVH